MTKNNPDILCPACRKFDDQFTHGSVRLDVYTQCDCDFDYPKISKEINSDKEACEFFRSIILNSEKK